MYTYQPDAAVDVPAIVKASGAQQNAARRLPVAV